VVRRRHALRRLDARNLDALISAALGETTPDAVCDLMSTAGIPCAPCASDGASYCVDVVIDRIAASETGAPVASIDVPDCNETCALSCDNAECPEAADFPVCQ